MVHCVLTIHFYILLSLYLDGELGPRHNSMSKLTVFLICIDNISEFMYYANIYVVNNVDIVVSFLAKCLLFWHVSCILATSE